VTEHKIALFYHESTSFNAQNKILLYFGFGMLEIVLTTVQLTGWARYAVNELMYTRPV